MDAFTRYLMTPRVPGNVDLEHRPRVRNPDGSISTVRSMGIGTDQGQVLIPGVDDQRSLTPPEAVDQFRRTGQHLGIFETPQGADLYAEQLHKDQALLYGLLGLSPWER